MNIELNFPPKLRGARSRLYRRRFLQVNTHWKALAEIYTMHSFAPFSRHLFWLKKLTNRNIEKMKSGSLISIFCQDLILHFFRLFSIEFFFARRSRRVPVPQKRMQDLSAFSVKHFAVPLFWQKEIETKKGTRKRQFFPKR